LTKLIATGSPGVSLPGGSFILEEIMNPTSRHFILSVAALLMATIACVLPGQTVQPPPTTNPINIETAVAGTAQAAAQQTQQANPITVTATVVIVPTDIPTATPKISLAGTSLQIREDQTTLFTDYKAGIQLVVPAGWLALRPNEEEYLKAFTLDVTLQNPAISDRLTRIQDANIDRFRMDAIDIRPEHSPHGIISDFNVIFQEGDLRSLEEWEKAERKARKIYANHKFLSAKYPQTASGIRVLMIEENWSVGQEYTMYYRGVFFTLPTGTLVLDFYASSDFKDVVLPDFDQAVNSVTLLNP
jgi:hypothetical protein